MFVRPELVVEIAFDGVQASTRYPGGVALRFARVKGYREDKRADEADTIETIRAIHAGRRAELAADQVAAHDRLVDLAAEAGPVGHVHRPSTRSNGSATSSCCIGDGCGFSSKTSASSGTSPARAAPRPC